MINSLFISKGNIMESYVFYFDESFHDRKIRINDKGKFNVLREDALENYIGVFWGCPRSELSSNRKLIERFENKQRKHYKLQDKQELKSTVISKKNFIYGVHSFNKDTLKFYQDLFRMLEVINPVIQVNMISKMELYLRQAFKGMRYYMPEEVNEKSFYYSLTKFMITYHNEELIRTLFDVHNYESMLKFRDLLLYNFECILKEISEIERKKREVVAFRKIVFVLKNSVFVKLPEKEYEFSYFINFDGLCKLLEEKNIAVPLVDIIIDNESKTLEAAQSYKFQTVKCRESHEVVELRLADWIATFIGRMIYGLYHDEGMKEDKVYDIRHIGENDLERKRILSEKWFELEEERFNLYKLIYDVLIIGHTEYWAAMTLSYGDQCNSFYSLLRYFGGLKDYEEYKNIDTKIHSEYYNASCCYALERSYERFMMSPNERGKN